MVASKRSSSAAGGCRESLEHIRAARRSTRPSRSSKAWPGSTRTCRLQLLRTTASSNEPAFFEQAVVDLLVAMGYGGVGGRGITTDQHPRRRASTVSSTRTSLGLNRVYIQAQALRDRPTPCSEPELQGFVGALERQGRRWRVHHDELASVQAPSSRRYATAFAARIILIDGVRLDRA